MICEHTSTQYLALPGSIGSSSIRLQILRTNSFDASRSYALL